MRKVPSEESSVMGRPNVSVASSDLRYDSTSSPMIARFEGSE